jgi:putative endonuclease
MLHMKQKLRKLKPKSEKLSIVQSTRKTKKMIGNEGEDVAVMFLMKQGFGILFRNYSKKTGEIDIIAEKAGKVHFIEVKSVTHETPWDVLHETKDSYLPEEKVNIDKIRRIKRTSEYFLYQYELQDRFFQFDLIIVNFYKSGEVPRINFYENMF